jgi:malic enzyme
MMIIFFFLGDDDPKAICRQRIIIMGAGSAGLGVANMILLGMKLEG